MTVFLDIAQCNFIEVYWRFRGEYCLHHQVDYEDSTNLWNVGLFYFIETIYYAVSQKDVIFILSALGI